MRVESSEHNVACGSAGLKTFTFLNKMLVAPTATTRFGDRYLKIINFTLKSSEIFAAYVLEELNKFSSLIHSTMFVKNIFYYFIYSLTWKLIMCMYFVFYLSHMNS